jgi:hypothetical protein
MFSIYTSLYRISEPNCFIDWKSALDNFSDFSNQIVVATFQDNSEDIEVLENYSRTNKKIKIVTVDTDVSDPFFDGKLKNGALKECNEEFCILCDGDERLRILDKPNWEKAAQYLRQLDNIDAFFIPVIDLFNTEREFRSLGQKWYLHKNLPNLNRGVVGFAKTQNNTINPNLSDSCELIYDDNTLCRTMSLVNTLNIKEIHDLGMKIFHLGWLDKYKRLLANQFWGNIWDARAGYKVNNIIQTKEELDEIPYWPHRLKLWYE